MHRFLSASILVACIPLFFYIPIWVSVWCLTISLMQILGFTEKLPKYFGSIFAAIGVSILLSMNQAYYSLDFCVALLALMTTIKPIEAKSHRDRAVTLCMAYFVTLTSLWYSNILFVAFYSLASITLTTSTLGLANNAFDKFSNSAKLASRILLQSIPFALILFVVFPRLNGSIWGLNVSSEAATGFSDSFSMGEVSELAKDDSPAFRVEFTSGQVPLQKYWRGIVFSFFDGKSWKQFGESPIVLKKREGLNPIEYSVILEPHSKNWMFALDYPISAPRGSKQTQDGVLFSDRPITDRKMYKLTSVTTNSSYIDRSLRRINTRIPYRINPRTIKLVESWKSQHLKGEAIVKEALKYFAENNFKYSLQPPMISGNYIDDFMFRTKEGYCEHFASAFTFMMRAARIPARVVGGYLGGEVNNNYTIVRQSDAHVWSEVWLPEYGWLRIDPTSSVGGVANAQAERTQAAANRARNQNILDSLLRNISLKIDAVNFAWDMWVLGYDREQQDNLLKSLGLAGKYFLTSMLIFGALGLVFGLGLLISYMYNSAGRKKASDKVARSYEKLISKFSKKGLEKPVGMGPQNYQRELETTFPELKQSIESIMQLYIRLRFEQNPSKEDELIFTKMVDELKVNHKASISKNSTSL